MSETEPGHESLTCHTTDLGICASIVGDGDLRKILILAFIIM